MLRVVSVVVVLFLISEAKKLEAGPSSEQWKEFQDFMEWKREKQQREYDTNEYTMQVGAIRFDRNAQRNHNRDVPDPPPVDQAALMARYVVNQADWASVATISTRKDTQTFPVANLISFSDGLIGSGSGIPYMYLTPLDYTAQDLAKDHRASLLMTLAQGSYCKDKQWDPMDPRCARIILTGKIKALNDTSAEYQFAKQAVFGRHPHLEKMPADHRFFFAKLKILAIALLDTFGGPTYINVKDYLHPPVDNIAEELQRFLTKRASQENFNVALNLPIYEARRT
ncbi:protein CREG1-like [Odontomachus brunneus]|uniref:protein CREG1-like n=1 Tax=Odontomachus brunneus TaxID=486640 RepID=UPI0013F1CDBE|nr:protein CREG1-like [Odontomachus brunneus]